MAIDKVTLNGVTMQDPKQILDQLADLLLKDRLKFEGTFLGMAVFSSKEVPEGELRMYEKGRLLGVITGIGK